MRQEQQVIQIRNVERVYNTGAEPVYALKGVSLEIVTGEYVAIMGTSGSGKSTLMNIIGCLDLPDSGTYNLDGREVQSLSENELSEVRNKKLGFVFQQFNLLPRMNALENVMLPLVYAGLKRDERKARAEKVLRLVGLGDRMHHRPTQLSGGQQQRVSIARALVNTPSVLLADEPTGALDSQTSAEIMTLFNELHEEGMTVILVTHEQDIAEHARRIVRLKDGAIISDQLVRRGAHV
ncbi:MAG: ABC transporter ATP-binding protein [Candidatus Obscuribacterales bacterium]|nr:ABC transporter ATP-binding protein [Candidatus Obscuribacterales bacterium]